MPGQLLRFMPLVAGLAAATVVYLVAEWALARASVRGAGARLLRFAGLEAADEQAVEVGSQAYRIRLAFGRFGLDVAGREAFVLWAARLLAAAALAFLIWLAGFPPLTALAGPVIAWFFVEGIVQGAWGSMRRAIEAEAPTFLSRMAATVQAAPNVLQALDEVRWTLDPAGPLQAWVGKLAARIRSGGRPAYQALLEEAEAISPSLGLAVFEIGRLWETGGAGYGRAFARAAENLSGILDARAQAEAKAAGARSAVRVVLGALVLVSVVLLRNPTLAPAIRHPVVQLAYLLIAAIAVLGWTFVNGMIEEAVE